MTLDKRIEEIKRKLDIQGFEVRHTETGWAWEVTKHDGTTLYGDYIGKEYWQDVFEREVLMRILMDNATPKDVSIGFDSTALGEAVKGFVEAEKLEKELDSEPEIVYFNDEVNDIHAESLALMLKKRSDYGTRNLTFHGEFGILVRIMDKIMRLTNIHQSGQAAVKDESIRDSWIDVINYGVLGLLAHENKLELPDRPDDVQERIGVILREVMDEVLAEEKGIGVDHFYRKAKAAEAAHAQELRDISAQAASIPPASIGAKFEITGDPIDAYTRILEEAFKTGSVRVNVPNFLIQSDVASKINLSGAEAWHAYDEPPKRKSKVYLAGSVEGIAPEVARGWRNEFKRKGGGYFNIFDPVYETNHLFEAGKTKEAWEVNWQAIQECDIFFCNLIPGAKSYGSLRELQRAYDLGKDIWLVRPEDTASDNSLPDIKNKFTDWVQAYIDMGTKYRGS